MVTTQFDITNTDVMRPYKIALMQNHPTINTEADWNRARQQQKNYETLMQVLSLRAQPMPINKPTIKIKAKKKHWTFTFTVEHDSVYFNGIDELGLLKEDIEHVPMIVNLDESIKDEYLQVDKNIHFKIENEL